MSNFDKDLQREVFWTVIKDHYMFGEGRESFLKKLQNFDSIREEYPEYAEADWYEVFYKIKSIIKVA